MQAVCMFVDVVYSQNVTANTQSIKMFRQAESFNPVPPVSLLLLTLLTHVSASIYSQLCTHTAYT